VNAPVQIPLFAEFARDASVVEKRAKRRAKKRARCRHCKRMLPARKRPHAREALPPGVVAQDKQDKQGAAVRAPASRELAAVERFCSSRPELGRRRSRGLAGGVYRLDRRAAR
jgi:hypothetical protein